MNTAKAIALSAFILGFGRACAQSADKEPVAIIEVGGAGGWSITDGSSSFGPGAAVEVTPIEDWLEIEAGVTQLFASRSNETDVDFLFKKPWTLSRKVEFMAGAGPEWVHTRQDNTKTNAVAAEAVLDFMFWPSIKHKYGWYVEPGYDYSFGRGHEQSAGISFGLLIAIR